MRPLGIGWTCVAGVVTMIASFTIVGTPAPTGASPRQEPPAASMVLLDQPIAVAPDGDFPVLAQAVASAEAREFAVDIYDRVPEGEAVGPVPDRDPATTFGPTALTPGRAGQVNLGFTIKLYRPGEDNPDPQWGHRLDEPGVYPVRIRLRDGEGRSIAVLMTTLLRLPDADQPVAAATATLLVDVHRPPPKRARDRRSEPEADQQLVRSLTPVLEALVERPRLPASFSVTPDTLTRWAADDGAASELGLLRRALAGDDRTVLDATYVDLDVASMVAAGIGAELVPQHDEGRQALTGLLEAPAGETWRLRDRIDQPVIALLRALDVSGVVLPDDAVATSDGSDDVRPPVSFESPIGPLRAVSTSAALRVGQAAPEDPVLDAHRVLARLAAAPGTDAVVSIDPDEADEKSLAILFDALTFGIPFAQPATIDDLLSGPEPEPGAPTTPRIRNLSAYHGALEDARASLASYGSMVPDQPELSRPYELALLVSAARDLPPDAATGDARSVTRALDEPFSAISTPSRDTVTLGARDATFPLTVESSLSYPVRVVVELQSSDRVEFPRNRLETTLEPGRQEIDLRVKVRTAGDTPVRISVRTPDDRVLLSQSRYTIRSTAVSGVGVLLTIGAAAFLAIWWGRHWHRSRRGASPSDPPPKTNADGARTV